MQSDIKWFFQSYDTCQMTVSKGTVSKNTLFFFLQFKALPAIDSERMAEIFLYRHLRGNPDRHGKSVYVRVYEKSK